MVVFTLKESEYSLQFFHLTDFGYHTFGIIIKVNSEEMYLFTLNWLFSIKVNYYRPNINRFSK